ncbi:hypothetical protein K7432_014488 [Basidiobolus ranarum]|uniref:CsbD-like domain-containing protein n=1 Tax=Basidiobolus ranarum TaxID=34480 RepID=A0ABR2VQA4_9FUNG
MDKVNAKIKYVTGYVLEAAGSFLGNEQKQAEGAAEQTQADVEYKVAQAQEYTQGAGEKLKGNVKDTFSSVISNEQMQAEGKVGASREMFAWMPIPINHNSDVRIDPLRILSFLM